MFKHTNSFPRKAAMVSVTLLIKFSTVILLSAGAVSHNASSAENTKSTKTITIPRSQRAQKAIERNEPILSALLDTRAMSIGSPVFIRIFKEESELEVWLQGSKQTYSLFKTYPICTFSGDLGPKQHEGDMQSPEGFYFVNANRLNPWSQYHLSFNLGYPNRYDRQYGRTGSALMVHGECVSIGCYAMTNPGIEEIYTLVHAALENGQPFFRVHAFPFRMTEENMQRHQSSDWFAFWQNLKQGYDWFENNKRPPNVEVSAKTYIFNE